MVFAFFPVIAAALFGLGYVFAERVLHAITLPTYMFLNAACALIVALLVQFLDNERISFDFITVKTGLPFYVLVAALAPSLGWLFSIYAVKNTSASYTAFAEVSYPLFALLFAFLFFGVRHFDWTLLLGGGLIMLGSFILISGQLSASR